MPTNRLTRLRYWPPGVYTEHLSARWRRSHPADAIPVIELPEPDVIAGAAPRIAVVCHAYYCDLLPELRRSLAILPAGADLYVSVPDDAIADAVHDSFAGLQLGRLEIRVAPNRGRDIAPKYVTFADVYEDSYDLLLFLHTKKTTQEIGSGWREHLLGTLIGSASRVDSVLELFSRDPTLGVLAPGHYGAIAANVGWHGSFPHASRLARRAGLVVRRWAPPDFASGSMFWARPGALRPIVAMGLRSTDFPREAGQNAYTVMHALERLVFVSAEAAGFTVGFLPGVGDRGTTARPTHRAEMSTAVPPLAMWFAALPPTAEELAREIMNRRAKIRPARIRAWCGRMATRIRVMRSRPGTAA